MDGFNLYYGAFGRERGWPSTRYKWLDIGALAAYVWPELSPIGRVRYFTALVKAPQHDPNMEVRQQTYLRALRASGVEIHLGTFKLRRKQLKLRGLPPQSPRSTQNVIVSAEAEIGKYDEKGSDVNLATYLVRDVAKRECGRAIVISNDSDLVEPLRVVRADFGVDVYLVNPQKRPVMEMWRAANAGRDLAFASLPACQLPQKLKDGAGTITRPPQWCS